MDRYAVYILVAIFAVAAVALIFSQSVSSSVFSPPQNWTNNTHLGCYNNKCVMMRGAGNNTCYPLNSSCGGTPDLTITSLSVVSTTALNATAYNATLQALVKNIGGATAGVSTTWFSVNPGPAKSIATPFIIAGQQVPILASFTLTGNKTYFALVKADFLNVVVESNENNNMINDTFVVPIAPVL